MNHHTAAHADMVTIVTDVQSDAMTTQLARQQSAMHCVRLAVERWRTGYAAAEAVMPSSQERWFAEAHGRFTAWLTAGGFAQDGTDPQEPPPAYAETAPQQEAAAVRHDTTAAASSPQRRGIAA